MQRNFQSIPEIPSGLSTWEAQFLTALKQNVELLCAFRDAGHTSVLKGEVTTDGVESQGVQGSYMHVYGVNSGGTPTVDYGNLVVFEDYQKLAIEVALLRLALNDLISRIK